MARILVVEDDANTRYLCSHILTRAGYAVIDAEDGLQALEILRADPHYDMVLTDYRMARMDGLELLAYMQHDFPYIPIVVMSVHTRAELVDEVTRLGAAAYLPKPFKQQQLLNTVATVLAPLTNGLH